MVMFGNMNEFVDKLAVEARLNKQKEVKESGKSSSS